MESSRNSDATASPSDPNKKDRDRWVYSRPSHFRLFAHTLTWKGRRYKPPHRSPIRSASSRWRLSIVLTGRWLTSATLRPSPNTSSTAPASESSPPENIAILSTSIPP